MAPTVRHSELTDSEAYSALIEEAFGQPIKVRHLQAMAEVPGVLASVFST